jgi:hypothetical protein
MTRAAVNSGNRPVHARYAARVGGPSTLRHSCRSAQSTRLARLRVRVRTRSRMSSWLPPPHGRQVRGAVRRCPPSSARGAPRSRRSVSCPLRSRRSVVPGGIAVVATARRGGTELGARVTLRLGQRRPPGVWGRRACLARPHRRAGSRRVSAGVWLGGCARGRGRVRSRRAAGGLQVDRVGVVAGLVGGVVFGSYGVLGWEHDAVHHGAEFGFEVVE